MIDERLVAAMAETLAAQPELDGRMAEIITPERALRYLSALEAVPCPSQTARWTRIPVVESLLREEGVLDEVGAHWDANVGQSGNAVLLLGARDRAKRVWLLSHLDQISYLLNPVDGGGERYPLTPICYHMQTEPSRPALALHFDLARQTMVVAARGTIEVAGSQAAFVPDSPTELRAGTRVVYDSDLAWDEASDELRGHLDDTVAVTASLLAANVLRHYPVEVLVGLTDEEEGPPGDANQSFGRGGRRLASLFPAPRVAIVSDVHEAETMRHGPGPRDVQPGDGAMFAERSSNGRGSVTPPPLYAWQQHLALALKQRGIRLRENWGGYVSRSEDINATAVTPNIALIGILCSNRHYAEARPAAALSDIVELAKVMVAYTLLAHSAAWFEGGSGIGG